jgi:hypothetical protein
MISGNGEGGGYKRRHAGENLMLLLPIEEVVARDNVLEPAAMRILFPEHDKLVCVRIWQRPEKNRVHDAEDRRVRTDRQG